MVRPKVKARERAKSSRKARRAKAKVHQEHWLRSAVARQSARTDEATIEVFWLAKRRSPEEAASSGNRVNSFDWLPDDI